jgi:hypothetical protein
MQEWKQLTHQKLIILESSSGIWLYSIEQIRDERRDLILSHFFAGWTINPKTNKKMRIEGTAFTVEECKAICSAHSDLILSMF